MGERNPPLKPDEQHPLLKIEGGGDMSHAAPTRSAVAADWGVACKKNPRFSRWPEFISAICTTVIICGISFLLFNVLGINQGQQFIIVRYNESKPASNVYYHEILPRGSQLPFVLYTEYLSNMAIKYPLLQFNVIFLIDEPEVGRSVKRNPTIYYNWFFNNKLDEIGKHVLNDFIRRYHNVNVTIIPLSKFMAKTPLKYKWRLIPQEHLLFYARVYSAWQNGGIGMDLKTFNNDYHHSLFSDRRIDAILTQHNDGINTAAYTKALNAIDQDEANAVFGMFFNVINHIMNHTRSIFNKTLPFPSFTNEKPSLVRTHRSKRDIDNHTEAKVTEDGNDSKNFYNIDNSLTLVSTNYTNNMNESNEVLITTTTDAGKQSSIIPETKISKVNGSQAHEVIFFYDFSIIASPFGKSGSISPLLKNKPFTGYKMAPHLLSLDSDGLFIAASAKYHPFLGHLASAGCFGMPPKFAIHDALVTQCSNAFKEDTYCDNIYLL